MEALANVNRFGMYELNETDLMSIDGGVDLLGVVEGAAAIVAGAAAVVGGTAKVISSIKD